jgi:Zn2+/Cd2+-exporting ATPase
MFQACVKVRKSSPLTQRNSMTRTSPLKTQQMQVNGMDCASCATKIERALAGFAGVAEVSVSAATERLVVSYDSQQVTEADIKKRVADLGYTLVFPTAKPHGKTHDHNHDDGHGHSHGSGEFDLKAEILPVLLVVALLAGGMIFEKPLHNTPYGVGEYGFFISAYLLSGWTVLKSAGRNILRGQVFDENFLMTVATLGAIAIHQLPEAVAVMLFYRIGELFQDYSVGRSRCSIKTLLEVRPDSANLKINGSIQVVSPETVKVGDLILVKPGEKIPLDGEVLEGNSQVDTSALTGESVPRSIKPGETVLAGMINQSGILTLRVTKLFCESSIAKILDLVENATSKKAETEKFITQFARYYAPIVVILSLAVAALPQS